MHKNVAVTLKLTIVPTNIMHKGIGVLEGNILQFE